MGWCLVWNGCKVPLFCCKMTLEVQENNTSARKLYHSVGFKGSFLNQEAGSQLFMTKHVYSPN
jgi:hypothetical protein